MLSHIGAHLDILELPDSAFAGPAEKHGRSDACMDVRRICTPPAASLLRTTRDYDRKYTNVILERIHSTGKDGVKIHSSAGVEVGVFYGR